MANSLKTTQRNKMIGYLTDAVRGAAAALDATHTTIGRELGLTAEQWSALAIIGRTTRSLSVSQLARQLRHSRQSTHILAVRLEQAGWIRFLRNPDDRRLLQMEITPAGRIILNDVDTRRNTWLITMTYDLEDSDLYVLMNTLRALQNRIVRARPYA